MKTTPSEGTQNKPRRLSASRKRYLRRCRGLRWCCGVRRCRGRCGPAFDRHSPQSLVAVFAVCGSRAAAVGRRLSLRWSTCRVEHCALLPERGRGERGALLTNVGVESVWLLGFCHCSATYSARSTSDHKQAKAPPHRSAARHPRTHTERRAHAYRRTL